MLALAAFSWGLGFGVAVAGKPHVVAILADDYGWADANWHRHDSARDPLLTPTMDELVQSGIEMDRHYVFKFCSPTRSAAQTGRNPIHVNTQNLDPLNYNPKDNVSGYSAVPRNMTGVAEVMKNAGYATHFFGKWDCGMATMRHTPRGRGYDTSVHYFHHMEGYWDNIFQNSNGNTKFFPSCQAKYPNTWIRDLWVANASYEGPAYSLTNKSANCSVGVHDLCTGNGDECAPYPGYPGDQVPDCTYVDDTFARYAVDAVKGHDTSKPDTPFFLFWAPHIVHSPLQVPQEYYEKFAHVDDWRRRRYHAMVAYMDSRVSLVVEQLKAKGMYNDTVIFFSSDNGGPIYGNGDAGANNYPLKGGKASNWEGGVRVNAWVSGGALPTAMRGRKLEGLSAIWDWYATFAALAGVTDPTDHAAAEAHLPALDSFNLWPYISGAQATSPRSEVALGTGNGQVNGYIMQNSSSGEIWKIVQGTISASGWTAPSSPNASFHTPGSSKCKPYCLYRLDTDPTEHVDLAFNASAPLRHQGREEDEGARTAGANCSKTDVGVCLKDSDILDILSNTVDVAACCQKCSKNPQCVAWNVNTHMKQCFLRKNYVPNKGANCTSGKMRDGPAPTPAPTPGPFTPMAEALLQKLNAAQATGFAPNRGNQDPQSCLTAMEKYNGYWGPWVGV